MEVSVHLHAPAALLPGKEPRYPLDRRLDGLQNRSGHGGGEKNLLPLRKSKFGGPASNIIFLYFESTWIFTQGAQI
jgi:hypothetical protein